mmetsp:Transcript_165/g.503  ORF Transcript_165/g.503 Transcript_165/m.503 type:complete len:375 (-) Transcript_165:33-1157(-)|eukprot:CAMPEP_0170143216 /NCGR_PEP_ID=MMETSP0033_2-20121228/9596_1 /TAXON_ID=195969 /ORGANISM="Dolichomastix tenuilepis, Strain CCMP3274" /LENGTH=374 /DNA_ID=CAMNT_0010379647 /DNA_START=30 /DNA_END=1154 /DNA_ORIENTATION=-
MTSTKSGISSIGGMASKHYAQEISAAASLRADEARKAKWDSNFDGIVDEEEVKRAEDAMLLRMTRMLDIIMLMRDKIRLKTGSYGTRELHALFKKFDLENDGECNWVDFNRAMQELGLQLSDDELGHLIAMLDADGSGSLTYKEFAAWMDERVVIDRYKLERIIKTQEGVKKAHNEYKVSLAYMKQWLKVHKVEIGSSSQVEEAKKVLGVKEKKSVTKPSTGERERVQAAIAKHHDARQQIVDDLRAKMQSVIGEGESFKDNIVDICHKFDANRDGFISWKEFLQGMKGFGIEFGVAELAEIMREFDRNCDGVLDYSEFLHILAPAHEQTDAQLEDNFEMATTLVKAGMLQTGTSRPKSSYNRGKRADAGIFAK